MMYAVVGQNDRVSEEAPDLQPRLVSGTHFDLRDDPAAGRPDILLHRSGRWVGTVYALDADQNPLKEADYQQHIRVEDSLVMTIQGGAFDPPLRQMALHTNGWQAWADAGSDIAGSSSLSGGRAMSGMFHHPAANLRCWQREVCTLDGRKKAVVQHWYRGGTRIGSQFGILQFEAA